MQFDSSQFIRKLMLRADPHLASVIGRWRVTNDGTHKPHLIDILTTLLCLYSLHNPFYTVVFFTMTNLSLNREAVRRVHGAFFLSRFKLSVVPTGLVFVDCRYSSFQYCGACPSCLANDERTADVVKLQGRLFCRELALAES